MNDIIDNTYHKKINNIKELELFLEETIANIPYCAPNNWETTTNEFINKGGLCNHFAQFLNNVLSENKQFKTIMIMGKAYNKIIEGRNYLLTNEFFNEPLSHVWNKFTYQEEEYICDPSTWGLHLTNNKKTMNLINWLKKHTLYKTSKGPGNLFEKYII
ncbi:MAG: hypothetical protein WC307_02445 [Candidatus Nanoarchaeia archaeon]|jgi:hypothetical protein